MLQSKIKSLQKQVSESGGQAFPDHQEEENSRPVGGHSVVELERVIGAMRKVIEKQQVDNETLKRSNAAARIGQGGKKMALLQEENAKLKVRPSPSSLSPSSTWLLPSFSFLRFLSLPLSHIPHFPHTRLN